MAFEGSAVSTTVLLKAEIKPADAVVAALRGDALNLALITLSRSYRFLTLSCGCTIENSWKPTALLKPATLSAGSI